MKYLLNKNIALRSWWYIPYAYYVKGDCYAKKLSREEFDFLSLCDGKHELSESELATSLLQKKLCKIAGDQDRLTEWQKVKNCNNRYFPRANWMITGRCNYNCLHCFNASDNNRLQSEFTLEEAKKLICQMEECGIENLTITGGEPMLHPHFMEIIREIYDHNMYVGELNTNGHFITQEVLDEMKKIGCRPLMKISFDGIGHHDWLRGCKGAEKDALRAIKLCIQNGFDVMVQTNVHRKNANSILETAKLMDCIGVKQMRIIRTTESPRWVQNAGDSSLTIPEHFEGSIDFCREYAKTDCTMPVIIWRTIAINPKSCTYHPEVINYNEGEYRDTLPVCKGNRGMIAVAANGHVFPCHQMSGYYEQQGDVLGNVKETGLRSILQESKYLSEVCTTVKDIREKNVECAKCKWFKYCCGGCRALGLALTGDKMGCDRFCCEFLKGGYLEKLAEAIPHYLNNSWINP